ncbi:MAG: hypothetical protein RSE62_03560 [Citrobacter sp.]
MVQAVIVAPSTYRHEFSKKMMRDKNVHFSGVLWETADYICKDPDCRCVTNGYGNYVTRLRKKVDLQSVAMQEDKRMMEHAATLDELPRILHFLAAAIEKNYEVMATYGYTPLPIPPRSEEEDEEE